jgi:hypothetical protein
MVLEYKQQIFPEIIDCIKIKEDFKTLFYKGAKGQISQLIMKPMPNLYMINLRVEYQEKDH